LFNRADLLFIAPASKNETKGNIMKILIIIILMLFPTVAKAEQTFFETLYDVPVMQGLIEVPDMSLTFDKPNGRISQAGAQTSNLSKQDILGFYNESLAQLGWKTSAEGIYIREGETLVLSFEGPKTVKFLLKPQ